MQEARLCVHGREIPTTPHNPQPTTNVSLPTRLIIFNDILAAQPSDAAMGSLMVSVLDFQ